MKKTILVVFMSFLMIAASSCGGQKHSKAFNESKKILEQIMDATQKAENCDDLEMAAFGILGLLGVEGLDSMPEDEQNLISELSEQLNTLMEEKSATLNCNEEEEMDDEAWPADEPVEEEVMD